jgi:prevent-host-death family protein
MPNIRPVSDLRNYNDVLKHIKVGDPVFLTKNGRGRYAIIDMAEYEKLKATIKLLSQLSDAEKAIENKAGWLSSEDVIKAMEG